MVDRMLLFRARQKLEAKLKTLYKTKDHTKKKEIKWRFKKISEKVEEADRKIVCVNDLHKPNPSQFINYLNL